MATSTKEKTTASLNMTVRKSFRDRVDRYVVDKDAAIVDVVTEGTDIYMAGHVPVIGRIPCGPLAEAIEDARYYEVAPPLLRPASTDFFLEATGDSMEPNILAHDLVLMRPVEYPDEVANGDVCAVQVYDNNMLEGPCTATLKQVYRTKDPHKIELRAFNEKYKTQLVEAGCTRIVGVMRGLVRSAF